MNKQYKTIAFVAGLDTKTDPKAVQAKLLTCKNVVFDSPGVIKKRNSFKLYSFAPQEIVDSAGNPPLYDPQSTRLLKAIQDKLFVCNDTKAYSVSAYGFTEKSGPYLFKSISTSGSDIDQHNLTQFLPIEASKDNIASGSGFSEPNIAVSASYIAYVWHEVDEVGTPNHNLLLTVKERSTGREVYTREVVVSATGITNYQPRVFILNDDVVYCWYDKLAVLFRTTYAISTRAAPVTAQIVTDLHADSIFDIIQSTYTGTDSFAIAYKVVASGFLKVTQSIGYGAASATHGVVVTDAICIFADDLYLRIAFKDNGTNLKLASTLAATLSLTSVTIATTSFTLDLIAGAKNPEVVTESKLRAGGVLTTSVVVFWQYDTGTSKNVVVYVVRPTPFESFLDSDFPESTMITRPYLVSNKLYIGLGKTKKNTGTTKTIQTGIHVVTFGFNESLAQWNYRRIVTTVASYLYLNTNEFYSPLLYTPTEGDKVWFAGIETAVDANFFNIVGIEQNMGSVSSSVAIASDYEVLTAGKPQLCSASIGTEIGFDTFPDGIYLGSSATGGSMSDGTYFAVAVYEYIDTAGNIHRSATSDAISVVLSAGGSSQEINASCTAYVFGSAQKRKNTSINFYRTINNGTTYYLCGSVHNQPYSSLVPVDLVMDDIELQKQVQLYTASGLIFDNLPPPMSNICLKTYDRVWLVNSMKRSELWYSKPLEADTAPEYNNSFTMDITAGGDIVGLADIRGNIVVIKEEAIYAFSGVGPGADGRGFFTQPQLVSNRGCISTESILQADHGIYYQTANGIYLLSTDFSSQYVGGPVEAYNANTVIGTAHMQDQNQARFMLDDVDNTILVHDYQVNQWAVFSDSRFAWSTGQAANWDDKTIICDSLDTCYLEDPLTVTNEPMEITTEWVQMAGWEGFQRIYEIHVLGTYKANHKLWMTAYRNYTTDQEDKYWNITSDPAPYALRTKPKYQQCRSMKYKIVDNPNLFDIYNMAATRISVTIDGTPNTDTDTKAIGLISNTDNNTHYVREFSVYTPGTADVVYSVVAKKGDKDWIFLLSNAGGIYSCYFDIDTGTIGTESNSTGTITSLGGGWYRCSMTYKPLGDISACSISPSISDGGTVFVGDGVTINTYATWAIVGPGTVEAPLSASDSVELNGLRIGYGVKKALAKSRSSST